MPTLVWIAVGFSVWTLCGVLAIAIGCAARRGDRLSDPALMGMDPSIELAPRRRMSVDVVPVARPWAVAGAGAPSAASALVEAGGPR
jgi:hypothetical protein